MHYYVPHTIRTNFGPRSLLPKPMTRAALTVFGLYELAAVIERRAMEAERDGQDAAAQRLHWRAAALREGAQ